jgi:hypothetical protein
LALCSGKAEIKGGWVHTIRDARAGAYRDVFTAFPEGAR